MAADSKICRLGLVSVSVRAGRRRAGFMARKGGLWCSAERMSKVVISGVRFRIR